MRVDHYECDECGVRIRRITIHKSELAAPYDDLHFCGTLCMNQFLDNIDPVSGEAARYWLSGQELRDGA